MEDRKLWISCLLCFAVTTLVGHSTANPLNSTNSDEEPLAVISLIKDKEKCMKDLGCFKITDDYKKRPLNLLPNDRDLINTKHMLYTKKNPKEAHYLVAGDKSTLTKSKFNPDWPTKFIVHGYLDSEVFGPWMSRIKDEFLLQSDYNVIVVDWSGGNKNLYSQATANTRVVGAEIAFLIGKLEEQFGLKPEDCHIIGHSLGAHIAGYAGQRLKNLGRITGADPAGPLFEGMPPTVRLDPQDAHYVDAIHTNSELLGIKQLVGHTDFFPNGGATQPGCRSITSQLKILLKDGINELFRSVSSCHHQRVVDLIRYSINYNKSPPVGYHCKDYQTYLAGKCADCGEDMKKCAILGIRADEYKPYVNGNEQKAFYLTTGKESPFWLFHYQVVVKLFKKSGSEDQKIDLELNLHGTLEDKLTKLLKGETVKHGEIYQFLVTSKTDLGSLKSVSLKFTKSSLNPLKFLFKPKLYVQYIEVNPMHVVEKSPRSPTGRVFCANPDTAIEPKTVTYFQNKNNCNMK